MKLHLLFLLLTLHKPMVGTQTPQTKYFIAMQYKGLSNCMYKVYITDSTIMCAKVNGYITVAPSFGLGTVIPPDLRNDPEAYVNKKLEMKYPSLLPDNAKFLAADKQNFIIRKKDIKKIYHNPASKWGMGSYPHNGRVMIQFLNNHNSLIETELILVGDQNPDEILRMLN